MRNSIICAMGQGVKWARCVSCIGEMRNYYKILNVKYKGKKADENDTRRLQNDMKVDLKDIRSCQFLGIRVTSSCEHGKIV